MIDTASVSFLAAGFLSAGLVAVSVALLRRLQMVDVANARSSHVGSVPRGGGVGVALAVGLVALGAVVVGVVPLGAVGLLLAFAVVMGGVGLLDDVRGLTALSRLIAQTAVCVVFTVAGFYSSVILVPSAAALLVTATVFLVGFVNAFNFMDGINGISGLTALVAGGWYAWLGTRVQEPAIVLIGAAVAGAAVGFLPFNVPAARVFLGDVGSYFIGALLGATACACFAAGSGALSAIAPLTLYVLDAGGTFLVRISRRESWRDAHRDHVYQRLVHQGGRTHLETAAVVAGVSAAICLSVALLPAIVAVIAVVVLAIAYWLTPRIIGRAWLTELD